MQDDVVPTRWQTFVQVVTNPFSLLQGVIEYFLAWTFTRRWNAFLLFMPALLVFISCVTLVAVGWFLSDTVLLTRYSEWFAEEAMATEPNSPTAGTQPQATAAAMADDEADAEESATQVANGSASEETPSENQLMETETVSDYAELLLRRILQLGEFNQRAHYLVALQMGRRGRIGQAQLMMRQIAPADSSGGYAPAHAWLAVDRLTRTGFKTETERDELLHDLEIASRWSGAGPMLLSAYADLLEKSGRPGDAIAVLTVAVQNQPELQVQLANMAYRNNRKQPLEQVSGAAKRRIQERLDSGKATATDYASLANLYLLDQEPDKAVAAAAQGLRLDADDPSLKRLVSEGLRMKYVLNVRSDNRGTQIDIGLLDAALKADPSNPAVSQEVARVLAMGAEAPPELTAALNEQLVNGQATAMTHLLVAVGKLKAGEVALAVPHLELALRQAPDSPVVLNNLALALARTKPEQVQRSLELIDKAVALVPGNAEYFDTQGEIRMLAGDAAGAIESYESAVRLDGSRIDTRDRLAKAYEQFGLTDMAEAQRKQIAKLRTAPVTKD